MLDTGAIIRVQSCGAIVKLKNPLWGCKEKKFMTVWMDRDLKVGILQIHGQHPIILSDRSKTDWTVSMLNLVLTWSGRISRIGRTSSQTKSSFASRLGKRITLRVRRSWATHLLSGRILEWIRRIGRLHTWGRRCHKLPLKRGHDGRIHHLVELNLWRGSRSSRNLLNHLLKSLLIEESLRKGIWPQQASLMMMRERKKGNLLQKLFPKQKGKERFRRGCSRNI